MKGGVCSGTLTLIGGKLWMFSILGSAGTGSRGSMGGGMMDVTTVEAVGRRLDCLRMPGMLWG